MQFSALLTAAFAATVSASSLFAPVQSCSDLNRYCGRDLRATNSRSYLERLQKEVENDPSLKRLNIDQQDFDNVIFCNVARGWGNDKDYRPVGFCSTCTGPRWPQGLARCEPDA